mgnify:CR=1 FL=1
MKIAWSYSVYYLTLHKFQKKKHFTEQIIAISQSEQSYHEIFRKLNITRIEFDSLKSSSFYELKKK